MEGNCLLPISLLNLLQTMSKPTKYYIYFNVLFIFYALSASFTKIDFLQISKDFVISMQFTTHLALAENCLLPSLYKINAY